MTETANLIEKAYAIQREVDIWLPHLKQTGELDEQSLARMSEIRLSILSAESVSDMDRLMQLGTIRSVASFLLTLTECEPDQEAEALALIKGCTMEILLGISSLRPKFEADAGARLEDLGLFVDREALQ